jgi:two-component system, LytTR family, response regulator AlgR
MNSSSSPKLRVLLVDDEELARMRLRSLVEDCPDPLCEVVGEAANATQALVWLATRECDLLLLDVRMPGRDGLQLADELKAATKTTATATATATATSRPPAVVFVTAHAEHALKAFDLDAVDYLTKPVRRERLQAALARVAQRLSWVPATAAAPVGGSSSASLDAAPVIVVNDRGRLVRVPVAEVLYLKAELKYVTLRTATSTHLLDDSLSDLEQRLTRQPELRFIRVHRNALVAFKAVLALERRAVVGVDEEAADAGEAWAVRVAPVDEWLAVSRRQVAAVREALAAGGV